jgi:16S rRNA (cytosine1402-N4)-methyltransferase
LHKPVLLDEALDMLVTDRRGIYVDCTVGGGGHLARLAGMLDQDAVIIGIDKDADVLEHTREKLKELPQKIILIHGDFRNLRVILKTQGITEVDGILLDLGVSSFQLDEARRGFSYQHDAPLDMRMNRAQARSAWELVNELDEEDLADIIWRYGEERFSRRIAREIVKTRQAQPINTTLELVEVIKRAVPGRSRRGKHPARRTFQALRIAVNQELSALQEVLPQALEVLSAAGRVCVITFHSLEDRLVKNFFRLESMDCICSKDIPVCTCNHQAQLRTLTKKPVVPGKEEQVRNPRSRSAKLRVAEKI